MHKQKRIHALFACISAMLITFMSHSASAAMELNGIATYTHLGKEQFIAGLYCEPLTDNARSLLLSDGRKRMEIKVLANTLLTRRFRRMWIEGVAINAAAPELEKHAQNLADFSNLIKPRLKRGDILVIDRTLRSGVSIEVNGIKLGVIKDPVFFDLLLRTWIGPVPLSSSFRSALLQKGSFEPAVLAMYQNISPTAERVAELREQISSPDKKPSRPAVAATPTKPDTTEVAATESAVEAVSDAVDAAAEAATPDTGDDTAETTNQEVASSDTEITTDETQTETDGTASETETDVPQESVIASLPTPPETPSIEDVLEEEEDAPDFEYTAAGLLAQQLYMSKLGRWTGGYVKYPQSAIRKNQQGTVRLRVTISKTGKVTDIQVLEEAEFKTLTKAAVKAVKRASPYPAIPTEIGSDIFHFTVPVVFALRE